MAFCSWFRRGMTATAPGGVKGRAMQSLRHLALAAGSAGVVWVSPAAADDWVALITAAQKSLADAGVNLGVGVTGFGQGLAAGDGTHSVWRRGGCPAWAGRRPAGFMERPQR